MKAKPGVWSESSSRAFSNAKAGRMFKALPSLPGWLVTLVDPRALGGRNHNPTRASTAVTFRRELLWVQTRRRPRAGSWDQCSSPTPLLRYNPFLRLCSSSTVLGIVGSPGLILIKRILRVWPHPAVAGGPPGENCLGAGLAVGVRLAPRRRTRSRRSRFVRCSRPRPPTFLSADNSAPFMHDKGRYLAWRDGIRLFNRQCFQFADSRVDNLTGSCLI